MYRSRTILSLAGTCGVNLLLSVAHANPVGERVVAGNANFNRSPGLLIVNQSSSRAIINWNSFSIGAGEVTRFVQPSASAAVLNRVLGGDMSQIYGTLEGNGRVYLINPAGILVGPGGLVNTRSFVASTLDLPDGSFQAGAGVKFSGESAASVQNQGTISASGGDVFLIARNVQNSGTIRAPRGTVGLAAGSEVLLQQSGRDRISVLAGQSSQPLATGVDNTGLIEAAAAELKAAGGNIYALAINNGGIVRATSLTSKNGHIVLEAEGGNIENSGTLVARNASGGGSITLDAGHNEATPATVINSGTIDARGESTSASGGTVRMTGDFVGLFGPSMIDVSGQRGGGNVFVGGGFHGQDASIQNARRTFASPESTIRADALGHGNGGRVVVWSDEATRFYGSISARGSGRDGDGGFAEVSGRGYLDYRGTVDMTAPRGLAGTLLLDPLSIEVVTGGGAAAGDVDAFADGAGVMAMIDPLTLNAVAGTVVLQAEDFITFTSAVNLTTPGAGLVAQAGGNITVNNTITTSGGEVHLEADSPHAPITTRENGTGTLIIDGSGSERGAISTGGGNVTLIGNDFDITGDVNAGTDGNIFISRVNDSLGMPQDLGLGTGGLLLETELAHLETAGMGTVTLGRATTAGSDGRGNGLTRTVKSITWAGTDTSLSGQRTTLIANDGITLNGDITTGAFTANADADAINSGTFTIGDGHMLATSGGQGNRDISITAADIVLIDSVDVPNGNPLNEEKVNAGDGNITLRPSTADRSVIVAGGTGNFNISSQELDNFRSTGILTIGRADGTAMYSIGAINLTDAGASPKDEAYGLTILNNGPNANTMLSGSILTQNRPLEFQTPITLMASVTLRSGSEPLTLRSVTDGNLDLTLSLQSASASGDVTFNGPVTVHTLETFGGAYSVRFNEGGAIDTQTTFANTGGVQFGDGMDNDGNGTVDETSTFTAGLDTTAGPLILGDGAAVTLRTSGSANMSLGSVAGTAGMASSSLTLDVGGTLTVSGTVDTDIGTLTLANSSGATFSRSVTANTVTLQNTAGTITFDGAVNATTLTTANAGYSVEFNDGGSVVDPVSFRNTGTVTLGDGNGDVFMFNGGVTTAGSPSNPSRTFVHGAVQTSDDPIHFGGTTLNGDTTLFSGSAPLTLESVGGNFTLTLQADVMGATGPVTFNGDVNIAGLTTFNRNYAVSLLGANNSFANAVAFLNDGGLTLGNDANDSSMFLSGLDTTGASSPLNPAHLAGTISGAMAGVVLGPAMVTDNALIEGDEIDLQGAVSGPGVTLAFQPFTTSRPINVGNALPAGNSLDLTAGELGNLADGFAQIVIGHPSGSGPVVVGSAMPTMFRDPIHIRSPGGDVQVVGALSTSSTSSDDIILQGRSLMIGAEVNAGNGDIILNATSAGASGAGALRANGLLLLGAGNFTLNSDNDVNVLAANVIGEINFKDISTTDNLTVGMVEGTRGLTSGGGNIHLTAGGLTISEVVSSDKSGPGADGHIEVDANTVDISGSGQVNVGNGRVTIEALATGRRINLGGNNAAEGLTLTADELSRISGSQGSILRIGNSSAGEITLASAISIHVDDLSLETGAGITQHPGAGIDVNDGNGGLAIRSNGKTRLDNAFSSAGALAARVTGPDGVFCFLPARDSAARIDVVVDGIKGLEATTFACDAVVSQAFASLNYTEAAVPKRSRTRLAALKVGGVPAWLVDYGAGAILVSSLEVEFLTDDPTLGSKIEEQSHWTRGPLSLSGSTAGPQTPK